MFFQDFNFIIIIYILQYPLHIASYALRIGICHGVVRR